MFVNLKHSEFTVKFKNYKNEHFKIETKVHKTKMVCK